MFSLLCAVVVALSPITETEIYKFEGQNDSATVIIYRLRDFQGALYTVKINEKRVANNFKMYQFVQLKVPAGEITLETSGNIYAEKKRFVMQVTGGKTYYLEAVVDYGYMSNALLLYERDEAAALRVMPKLTEKGKRW